MKQPTISMETFKKRRQHLLEQIGQAILILPAATEKTRNRDCHYTFRQDSDFLYLSDFNEPNAIIVLDGKQQKSFIFSKPYDELHIIWEGDIIGQERAKKDYLFDEAYPLETFDEKLIEYCFAFDNLITPFGRYLEFDHKILQSIQTAKNTRRARAPQNWLHSDQFIHPMRLIKDTEEISLMQHAANISIDAHKQAMAQTKPNMNEAEIAALLDFNFGKAQGTAAYSHIVAGGNNACTLHYTENNNQLKNNDLILIDAGCEYRGYAADITRTFPVNGKFTAAQKKVYQWVLKSMDAAIEAAKSGNTIRSPHFAAEMVLIEGMIDLGLVSGTIESVKADNSYQRYFMHGTSHWLGIDVHDVGDYKDENGNWLTLEPGMAITVEPGLYIREDDLDAPTELRGIGIRIEDDIIITKDGHINLTEKTPKSIEAIEAMCSPS